MIPDARALLPTDLLALVAHGSSSSYENEAWPRERLGAKETQPTLTVLRDQLLALGRQRTAWVSVRRQKLQALTGARERGGRAAWEIDYLVDCAGDERVVAELLSLAIKAAGESRAEKLFLRLGAESELLTPARKAGFVPYKEETLYVANALPPTSSARSGASAASGPSRARSGAPAASGRAVAGHVRPVAPADSYPLFRLYTAATPEPVRRHEAVTYSEWLAATERRWMRNGVHLVAEREGRLSASVTASALAHAVHADLTLDTQRLDEAPELIRAAVQALGEASGPLTTLVSSSNQTLARLLEDAGFEAAGEYVSLMHRTTRPLSLPKAIPAAAKNALGV